MRLSYLGNQSWLDITREERLFCSHLYQDIRSSHLEQGFVQWLKEAAAWKDGAVPEALVAEQEWEIGYEVCFYRDLLNSRGESVNSTDYPNKRTFDLCLFSEQCVVIVEAKVHERFDGKQLGSVIEDRDNVKRIIATGNGDAPEVVTIALASSAYFDNVETYGHSIKGPLHDAFDGKVTWKAVSEFVNNPLYAKADGQYPHGAAS